MRFFTKVITRFTPYKTLGQLFAVFQAMPERGTKIAIFNLKSADEIIRQSRQGQTTLNFQPLPRTEPDLPASKPQSVEESINLDFYNDSDLEDEEKDDGDRLMERESVGSAGLEFDLSVRDDIQLVETLRDTSPILNAKGKLPPALYSLRDYMAILYLEPRMQVGTA